MRTLYERERVHCAKYFPQRERIFLGTEPVLLEDATCYVRPSCKIYFVNCEREQYGDECAMRMNARRKYLLVRMYLLG